MCRHALGVFYQTDNDETMNYYLDIGEDDECEGCENQFLNQESCEFAGHTWEINH